MKKTFYGIAVLFILIVMQSCTKQIEQPSKQTLSSQQSNLSVRGTAGINRGNSSTTPVGSW